MLAIHIEHLAKNLGFNFVSCDRISVAVGMVQNKISERINPKIWENSPDLKYPTVVKLIING